MANTNKIQIPLFPVPQNQAAIFSRILRDDHTIEYSIGKGGMSFGVYLVKHKPTNTYRALKVVSFDDETEANNTKGEIAYMGSLRHPSIVQFYHSEVQGKLLGIFMEFLDGLQLDGPQGSYVKSKELGRREYCQIFDDILRAEHYAHTPEKKKGSDGKEYSRQGTVHLDLKPSNIIVVERNGRDVPVIIDFGLSKAVGERSSSTIGGSDNYKAPECVWTSTPMPTMDLFSTGVMLYNAFSGAIANANIQGLTLIAEAHGKYGERIKAYLEQDPKKPRRDPAVLKMALEQQNPAFKNLITEFEKFFKAQINSAYNASYLGGEGSHLDKVIRHSIEFGPNDRYKSAEGLRIDMNLACHPNLVSAVNSTVGEAASREGALKFLRTYKTALEPCRPIASLECLAESQVLKDTIKTFRDCREQIAESICACMWDRFTGPPEARMAAFEKCIAKLDPDDQKKARAHVEKCKNPERKPVDKPDEALKSWNAFFSQLPTERLAELWDVL